MKDWFYEKFVRKNPRVQRAYETYVQGHLEEHQRSRFKHWLILLALSWKYRRSQINRLHTLTLAKLKDNKAKIRMEWIPGACCYNLYVSQDGLHYRFQEKTRHHLCEVENMEQDQMASLIPCLILWVTLWIYVPPGKTVITLRYPFLKRRYWGFSRWRAR